MEVKNFSYFSDAAVCAAVPAVFDAEAVVAFPDFTPASGGGPAKKLRTGLAVRAQGTSWKPTFTSDAGCGMRLCRLRTPPDLERRWNSLYEMISVGDERAGDLGRGNHFVQALSSTTDGSYYLLIHTGPPDRHVERENAGDNLDDRYASLCAVAEANRQAIARSCAAALEVDLACAWDYPHNTVEHLPDSRYIVRKGAIKMSPGAIAPLPSTPFGRVALVEGKAGLADSLHSMNHGTGKMSAAEVHPPATASANLPPVLLPTAQELRRPEFRDRAVYRPLNGALEKIFDLVRVVDTLDVVAYIGGAP